MFTTRVVSSYCNILMFTYVAFIWGIICMLPVIDYHKIPHTFKQPHSLTFKLKYKHLHTFNTKNNLPGFLNAWKYHISFYNHLFGKFAFTKKRPKYFSLFFFLSSFSLNMTLKPWFLFMASILYYPEIYI